MNKENSKLNALEQKVKVQLAGYNKIQSQHARDLDAQYELATRFQTEYDTYYMML